MKIGQNLRNYVRTCYLVDMREQLPHNADQAEEEIQLYMKLMNLHRELASLYRTKSRDYRTISNLWYHIDGLELDLRSRGVVL